MKKLIGLLMLTMFASSVMAQSAQDLRRVEKMISDAITSLKDMSAEERMKEACNFESDSYDLEDCPRSMFVFTDRQLNYVWKEIKKKNPKLSNKLLPSQRAFIQKRNIAAAKAATQEDAMIVMSDLTDARIEQLLIEINDRTIAEGVEEIE